MGMLMHDAILLCSEEPRVHFASAASGSTNGNSSGVDTILQDLQVYPLPHARFASSLYGDASGVDTILQDLQVRPLLSAC